MPDIIVESGQTSTGLTLTENTMKVLAGGTATKTRVETHAYLIVSDGGVRRNNTTFYVSWRSYYTSRFS